MSLEGRTIALVEDDPIMGESLADRLSLEGANVIWWQDCRAAVDNLGTSSPDLVVCDIRLPDGTGEDVFRIASAMPEGPPFLFVTGHADIDQAVRLMRNGAGDYLTKPFEMSAFLSRLGQLLRPTVPSGAAVLGVSRQMLDTQRLLQRIGHLSAPVLLTGRDGRRQGGVRPLPSRAARSRARSLRGRELRGDPEGPDGERAVRP